MPALRGGVRYPHGVSNTRTIVIGAGLSGLACAFDLVRAGLDVVVLESEARPGGVVATIERDGFRFETGPNTIQASAEEFRKLCGDLCIADRLIASDPEARDRYLWFGGRLVALPGTPFAFVTTRLLSIRAKLFVASEVFRRWKGEGGTSGHGEDDDAEPDLATFLGERLGREATRVLAGAFVRGVYAAELDELGAKSAFPRMWKAVQDHGGLLRALWAGRNVQHQVVPGPQVSRLALLSFPSGLQEIVEALARATGERLHTGSAAVRIERGSEGWRVTTRSGDSFEGGSIVLAVSAPIAARLLETVAPVTVPLGHLRGIRHARVSLVHLGFESSALPGFPAGFGYLVPPTSAQPGSADPRVLGTIFTSNLFSHRAPQGCAAVSSFYRGSDVEALDEKALIELASLDLARALRISEPLRPRVALTQRWNDVIPHYAPGHAARMSELLARLATDLPGLQLAGCYTAGVSVEQVVARGRAVARAIVERAGSAPSAPSERAQR